MRLLLKPTSGREFVRRSERKTGMYVSVHEDLSTEPRYKLPAEAGFEKKSLTI
ncbi:MAG: palindromic element RPE1 domain-containing protein [Proteobacteria bacterium]|nr:palindromic element RPE1 domain-containing protein [Pseudomonadota bacterium]